MFSLLKHRLRNKAGKPAGRRKLRPRKSREPSALRLEWLEDRSLLALSDLLFDSAFKLGSTGEDLGKAIATDTVGNYYVAGGMEGTVDFDPTAAVVNRTGNVFAAKYTAAGDLAWVRTLSGSFGDQGGDIFVDASSNVYLTGSFQGTVDFDPGPGTLNLTSAFKRSVFVLKLNPAGELTWAKQYTGNKDADATDIEVDTAGNVYTVGTFGDPNGGATIDFDPGTGAGQVANRTSLGKRDAFVASLNSAGNFRWAATAGGSEDDKGFDIGLDAQGNVYAAGEFLQTADFDPGPGTSNLTSAGQHDVFVWKLSGSGNSVWARQMGGPSTESALGLAVDAAGSVYTTGFFFGNGDYDPGPGVFNLQNSGGGGVPANSDVFVSKLTTDGNFGWAKRLGGTSDDRGTSLAVDADGQLIVLGNFQGTGDFDPGPGTMTVTSTGLDDIFITHLQGGTGEFGSAGRVGGFGQDEGFGVAVDNLGHVFTTGSFEQTADIDPGVDALGITSAGETDAFVLQLTFDVGLPRVTIEQSATQPDPTNGFSIFFTAEFSEPVTGFETGDVTLSGTAAGTLGATVTPVGVEGTTYEIEVTGMTGSGTVIASLAAGVAVDSEDNGNPASTSSDNVVQFDTDGPTAIPANPASGGSIGMLQLNNRKFLDITFADPGGSGLDLDSIIDVDPEFTLSGAGADVTLAAVAPTLVSGTTYRYQFTGDFVIGLVGVEFIAGSFLDQLGNENLASAEEFTAADLPTVSVTGLTVTEGNTGASANLNFTVSLSFATEDTVTVQFATADGTATAGSDYVAKSGVVTFLPNVTTQTVSVVVSGDVLNEPDETVVLNLASPANAKLPDPIQPGVGTILDNDATPTLSISDVTVAEGAGTATFTVSLSAISGREVSFTFATPDNPANTATAGSDYTTVSATTLTIPAGQLSTTVQVEIREDLLDEASETFRVNLSAPTNATIGKGVGIGTITDNDAAPTVSITDQTVLEGDLGTTTVRFTVSLSAPSGQLVSVNFATANGTATAGKDYTAANDTLTFPPGATTLDVDIAALGDTIDEPAETFLVNLSTPINATILDNSGTGTITDDDPEPAISIGGVTVVEGNSGVLNAVFPVTLSAASTRTISVQYATADDTATAGKDYTTKSGTVTFAPGTVSQNITVQVRGDVLIEGTETFFVNLQTPVAATLATGTATGTVTDNDPSATISDVTVTEGGLATFTVTLSMAKASTQPNLTIDWSTGNDTASAPDDFTRASGTLTFGPGVTKQMFTVSTINDTLDEAAETFFIVLSNPTGGVFIADNTGKGTINDNDLPPVLSISGGSVNETLGVATYTVNLSTPSGQVVTVKYGTGNISAQAGKDYTATSGTLTIPAGETSGTIPVPISDDASDELDTESLKTTLSSPKNATLNKAATSAQTTITDNDAPPNLFISDARVTEGDGGSINAVFTVSLSVASGKTISVTYATTGVTATAGKDFTAKTGTLTFAPGVLSQTITVPVLADKLDELDQEVFEVRLTNTSPENVTIPVGVGTGIIDDNDKPPTVSINNAEALEDDINGVNGFTAQFLVSLSAPSAKEIQVRYNTQQGTATEGTDYLEKADWLVFAPGVTVQPITIKYVGDKIDELNESYFVHLAEAVHATVLRATGTGTITDNDIPPTLTINDASVTEGGVAVFTVSLSERSGQDVRVNFFTAAGATNPAKPGADFTNIPTLPIRTLVIPAGELSAQIPVTTLDDEIFEGSETFQVKLVSAVNAKIQRLFGTGTILDDDAPPVLNINNAQVIEGNSGTRQVVFTITKTGATVPVSVSFATRDGVEGTAFPAAAVGQDYVGAIGGLTFGASTAEVSSVQVSVVVRGDLEVEPSEFFELVLKDPTNATLNVFRGTAFIQNDDPTVSISNVTVSEGDAQTVSANFTVSLSAPILEPVSVSFNTTTDGSATAGVDYTTVSGTLTFQPGQAASQTISVPVLGDLLDELSETFHVRLSDLDGGFFASGEGTLTAQGTITDNDLAPVITFVGVSSTPEGDSSTTTLQYAVDLSAPSGQTVTVQVATVNGTATTADNDYVGVPLTTLTFLPGETEKEVDVVVNGDSKIETSETLVLKFSAPTNATLPVTQRTITITDDDARSLSIDDVTIVEGSSGTKNMVFTVTLSRATDLPVTVKFATANGTAAAGSDYVGVPLSTLTFAPGELTRTITVSIKGDAAKEADETFFVNLTTPTNATLADAQGKGTITNDDVGAGQISVTIVGSGFVVDNQNPKKIDTRIGKFLGAYAPDSFPILSATDGAGNIAHSAEWFDDRTGELLSSLSALVLDDRDFMASGLSVTVFIDGRPLLAGSAAASSPGGAALSLDEQSAALAFGQIVQAWAGAGLGETQLARLQSTAVRVVDLPGQMLGVFIDNTILLDRNAAGFGWFIDATPTASEEFSATSATTLTALDNGPADNRMDLLTVLAHEMGHALGLADLEPSHSGDDLMAGTLLPGIRRADWTAAVDAVLAEGQWH